MADLIERFLDGKGLYGQEWNDFVEVSQNDWRMDAYRRSCYELDPIVNCPDPQDPIALSVLRSLVLSLRTLHPSAFRAASRSSSDENAAELD
jgi:hypothetical protein